MRILIIGSNGMLGHTVAISLMEEGYEVLGVARKDNPFIQTVIADASDLDMILKIISENPSDVIINCAGILNEMADRNKLEAIRINSMLPRYLEFVTAKSSTRVIHISTDCVFSGNLGSYSEDSFRDGDSFYARTKALGELDNNKDLTIRTSLIGPDMNSKGIGLFNWFTQQSGTIYGYSNVMWTGQTNVQMSKTIQEAIRMNTTGLFNVIPNYAINKYDLLQLFNDECRLKKIMILKDENMKSDKTLRNERVGFEYSVPDYKSMVIEMRNWIVSHKDLYPHYEDIVY